MTVLFTNNVASKLNTDEVMNSHSNNVLNELLVNAIKESAGTYFPTIIPERQSTPWQTDEKLQELFQSLN